MEKKTHHFFGMISVKWHQKKPWKQTRGFGLSQSSHSATNENPLHFKSCPKCWRRNVPKVVCIFAVSLGCREGGSCWVATDVKGTKLEDRAGGSGSGKRAEMGVDSCEWGTRWPWADSRVISRHYEGTKAKEWGGDGIEEMVQTDEATYAKTALGDVGLRERGPVMMEERGQVPDDEGWLCPIIRTVSISRSIDEKLGPAHMGWGESLFTNYYRKLIWFY